jgi:glycerophosphoryl diester phosphodiesterase
VSPAAVTALELEIIAHRGFSARAPENTLSAVELAIRAGADAIEWDVHATRDGTPVLFHDFDLSRTSDGSGRLADHTLAELQALDAGGWFSPEFARESIPTLEQALARTRGRVRRVYTEVKGSRESGDLDRMVEIVRAAGRVRDNVFISLDWAILEHIAARDAEVAIGYIVDEAARFEEGLERASSDGRSLLDFDYRILLAHPDYASRALERGIALAVWTVDGAAEAERLRALGVTRFTTNRVDTLLAWRDGAA